MLNFRFLCFRSKMAIRLQDNTKLRRSFDDLINPAKAAALSNVFSLFLSRHVAQQIGKAASYESVYGVTIDEDRDLEELVKLRENEDTKVVHNWMIGKANQLLNAPVFGRPRSFKRTLRRGDVISVDRMNDDTLYYYDGKGGILEDEIMPDELSVVWDFPLLHFGDVKVKLRIEGIQSQLVENFRSYDEFYTVSYFNDQLNIYRIFYPKEIRPTEGQIRQQTIWVVDLEPTLSGQLIEKWNPKTDMMYDQLNTWWRAEVDRPADYFKR